MRGNFKGERITGSGETRHWSTSPNAWRKKCSAPGKRRLRPFVSLVGGGGRIDKHKQERTASSGLLSAAAAVRTVCPIYAAEAAENENNPCGHGGFVVGRKYVCRQNGSVRASVILFIRADASAGEDLRADALVLRQMPVLTETRVTLSLYASSVRS